jgi:hypothetical protein
MGMQARLFILLASLALALSACAKTTDAKAPADLKKLTVDEVAARIAANDGKTFIYDNNPKALWIHGHVPGAKWLDEEHVTAADLPADKTTSTLIFYCHSET